jgi:DNA-binding transcriptional MerR regulator
MREMYGRAFYTTDEIAILFGVTSRTIQNWVSKGSALHLRNNFVLNPVNELNGRRLFKSEEIHLMVKQVYGIDISVEEAKKMFAEHKTRRATE